MEAGRLGDRAYDLIDVMVKGADKDFSDDDLSKLERAACPTCLVRAPVCLPPTR